MTGVSWSPSPAPAGPVLRRPVARGGGGRPGAGGAGQALGGGGAGRALGGEAAPGQGHG